MCSSDLGNRKKEVRWLWDDPRQLGNGWVRLVGTTPPKRRSQDRREGGRIHQLLWRASQPVKMRSRSLAARNDEKPFRVGSSSAGWFRACVNRSHPEGVRLLLCISTGQAALAGGRKPVRINQRRRKAGQSERLSRGEHEVSAGPVKNSRNVGDPKNGTAGL